MFKCLPLGLRGRGLQSPKGKHLNISADRESLNQCIKRFKQLEHLKRMRNNRVQKKILEWNDQDKKRKRKQKEQQMGWNKESKELTEENAKGKRFEEKQHFFKIKDTQCNCREFFKNFFIIIIIIKKTKSVA